MLYCVTSELPMPRGAIKAEIDYETLRQEPWLTKLLERLKQQEFKLDRSILDEIKTLASIHTQAYRESGVPRLPVVRNKLDLLGLQEQNALCLAHRDRVVEILVNYTAVRYALEELWERAEARFLEHPSYRALTNEPARRAFCTALLGPLHRKRSYVKQVIETAEILKEHLSHTHFTIKQHVEMGVSHLDTKSA
jgi:hypothetical protein